jgi:hypothetical protein
MECFAALFYTFSVLFIYLFAFYLTMLFIARLCTVEWMDDRRIMIWKGFGRRRSCPN